MWTFVLVLGVLFSIVGLILLIAKAGEHGENSIRVPGVEFKLSNSALVVFVVGVILVFFGAKEGGGRSDLHADVKNDNSLNRNANATPPVTPSPIMIQPVISPATPTPTPSPTLSKVAVKLYIQYYDVEETVKVTLNGVEKDADNENPMVFLNVPCNQTIKLSATYEYNPVDVSKATSSADFDDFYTAYLSCNNPIVDLGRFKVTYDSDTATFELGKY